MRHARVPRILGIEVAAAESEAILTRLGLGVTPGDEALTAEIPYERGTDLTREIDLIEEVGRVRGLDDIPARAAAPGGHRPPDARPGSWSAGSRACAPTSG